MSGMMQSPLVLELRALTRPSKFIYRKSTSKHDNFATSSIGCMITDPLSGMDGSDPHPRTDTFSIGCPLFSVVLDLPGRAHSLPPLVRNSSNLRRLSVKKLCLAVIVLSLCAL